MAGPVVAVVGGGYSGTAVAVELARAGAEAILVERGPRFAAGAAYGTNDPQHLLNVRAKNMSALDGEPAHFLDWANREGVGGAESFVPRRDYHRYISGLLDEAVASGRVRLVRGEAVRAGDGTLVLGDGTALSCNAVVLAGGNYPSRLPGMLRGPTTLEDPWGSDGTAALAALAGQTGDILLVGTGLTMVDVALALAGAGFGGRMIATSRRGLVPRAHEEVGSEPLPAPPVGPLPVLVRHVRRTARDGCWRPAVDALRPVSHAAWRGLSLAEKRRFLRHLRPWWDVHRHRIAPEVGRRIEALRAGGRLEVVAGRITGFVDGEVTIARRGDAGDRSARIAGVVNCTGPEGRIDRVEDPLVRDLLESGRGRADELGIGLDIDEESRLLDRSGKASLGLYAVGPLTRGAYWEIVAVPDIRGQARRVAAQIVSAY